MSSLRFISLTLFAMSVYSSPLKGSVPLLSSMGSETIRDSYIVAFKKDISKDQIMSHHQFVFTNLLDITNSSSSNIVTHYYDSDVFKGYAGKFEGQVVDSLRASPIIDYIEKDQIVHTTDVQQNAPWGLARISHQRHPVGQDQTTYTYPSTAGEGVVVYVVDTGININHVDFQGRAKWGATIPTGDTDTDANGHGTHVAGTIASHTFGVAKKATVVAVKVLGSNGSGTMSDVIQGVQYVVTAHQKRVNSAPTADAKRKVKSVANMSLGGGSSAALNQAVNAAVSQGVLFAVAAGNDAQNACYYSPAGAGEPITVGASTISDTNAYFSNSGQCVDVFAPGYNILSTWIGSNTATNTISGTSMASPHVAGLAALFLGNSQYAIAPAQLKADIINYSTNGVLSLSNVYPGTPNKLIYNLAGTYPAPSEENPKVELTWDHHRSEKVSIPAEKVSIRHNDILVTVLKHDPSESNSETTAFSIKQTDSKKLNKMFFQI